MGKRGRPPLFERLQAGLEDVLRHERGEIELRETRVSVPEPPPAYSSDEVHRIRERLQLSQAAFASLLCVSNKTVQGWEQGLRVPSHAWGPPGESGSPWRCLFGWWQASR